MSRLGKRLRGTLVGLAGLFCMVYATKFVPLPSETTERTKEREAQKDASAAMYTSTPEQRAEWARALRRSGWNCQVAKKIWWRGEDARGINAKVMCGPPGDSTDVYSDRIFNATMRPNGVLEAKQGTLYD